MTFYQKLPANQNTRNLRGYLVSTLLGTALLAGVIGINAANKPSNNIKKYIKNHTICAEMPIEMPDYAARQFVRENADSIVKHSMDYGARPELVAAAFLSENSERQRYEDWKDWLATGTTAKIWDNSFAHIGRFVDSKFGYTNPSLGPGQVKVKTAMHLERKFGEEESTREDLEKKLLDADANIKYTAMAIADIIRRNRKSGRIPDGNIFDDPQSLVRISFEYVGSNPIPSQDAPLTNQGIGYRKALSNLIFISEIDFRELLGEHSTITETQQEKISKYIRMYVEKDLKLKKLKSDIYGHYDRKARENRHKMLQC